MLLLRTWRWQITLDCKMSSLLDTPWVLLNGFASMAWNKTSESTIFGLPDCWRFCNPVQNFLNHLVAALWSTASSPFTQQMFLVASMALWSNSNSESICSWIRLCCMFICVTFKYTSNTQHVSTQTTMILTTTAFTSHCLNCFSSCDICAAN